MRTIALTLLATSLVSIACAQDWIAFGQGAAVQKLGETVSLQYKIAAGHVAMAVLPMPDGKLADGHLNLSKVRMISLADVSGLLSGESAPNTIWIADMRAQ